MRPCQKFRLQTKGTCLFSKRSISFDEGEKRHVSMQKQTQSSFEDQMLEANGTVPRSSQTIEDDTHVYPSWFIEARRAFEQCFEPLQISQSSGPVLTQPVFDAISVGRRIRPALYFAFWNAEKGHYPDNKDAAPAVATELFHSASIIVDDLADREDVRRDKVPIFHQHGEELAVLSSHSLVSTGYRHLLSADSSNELVKVWTKAYQEACIGQSLDYASRSKKTLREQQALSLRKTEAFFGFLGASLDACLLAETHQTLFREIGRIFQIGNDVIDLLNMETSNRICGGSAYPLRLSYLVPDLVECGVIKSSEVFSQCTTERLQEISVEAKRHLPHAAEVLDNEVEEATSRVNNLLIGETQKEYFRDFVKQCCTYSFWNHDHEAIA